MLEVKRNTAEESVRWATSNSASLQKPCFFISYQTPSKRVRPSRQLPTEGNRRGEQSDQKAGSLCQMYSFPLGSFKEISCAPTGSMAAMVNVA